MEKGLSENDKVELFKSLREKWSFDKIKNLELEDYSRYRASKKSEKSSSTFVYDIEYGDFNRIAYIGKATSNIKCIYGHGQPSTKANMKSDDEYSWYKKYGKTRDEAWQNIRQELINLLQNCKNNEDTNDFGWVYNENSTLGTHHERLTNYKKAIIFLYQHSDFNKTTLIPIFNKDILDHYVKYKNLSLPPQEYYELQKFLIKEYNIQNLSDAIKKSVEIWELWEDSHS